MARPQQISNEQILRAMRHAVLELGGRVSLDVVAQRLGVTSPALLKRFGNRETLLIEALKPPENPPFIVHFEQGPNDAPFVEQLRERFSEMMTFFEEVIPCMSALRESGIAPDKYFDHKHRNPLRALRAMTHWLTQAHQRGLTRVAGAEVVASAMLGALQIRVFSSYLAQLKLSPKSNRQYLDELVEFFANALCAPAPSGRPALSRSAPTKAPAASKPRRRDVA